MAKVAAPGTLPSTSLQIGGGSHKVILAVKRKTPSELRGEQLKRKNDVELGSPATNATEVDSGVKKPDVLKNSRYIDTRVDEVFPVKKSRFRIVSGKENAKENSSVGHPTSLQKISVLSNLAAKRRQQISCPEDCVASVEASKDDAMQGHQTLEKCSQGTFLSVTELSLGGERSSGLAAVDMDKALKGLAAHETVLDLSAQPSGGFEDTSSVRKFCSEFTMPGHQVPLDFTLKTYMRLLSSSSVDWFHRSVICGSYNGVPEFPYKSDSLENQSICSSSGSKLISQVLDSNALHSWVYPQSILPSSLISVLASSASGGVEMDFLRKRQQMWEDSFRSLYYMFRNNVCSIFYVCTSHFVVMFTATSNIGRKGCSCSAFISQSTGSWRSVLKENDVSFSMPLCHSKDEQAITEDLVELLEIEKHNLGQTRHLSSASYVDNTPESLLAFSGNENVHGLYEILLNYRSFTTLFAIADVPVLYSPVPFQNASLHSPEVKCMEIRGADPPKGSVSKDVDLVQSSSTDLFCSIEIRDTYLPPWIISRICNMMGSKGKSFEASFTTERTSVGLNIALEAVCGRADDKATATEDSEEMAYTYGIPGAIVSPKLCSGLLKGLKYCSAAYKVSLSPV